jgi:DNA polymerase I-like protein with 3'-5' exonuclease and polymerase domains
MISGNNALMAHSALVHQGRGYRGYRERPKYISPIPVVPENLNWRSDFKMFRVGDISELLDLEKKFLELGNPEMGVDTETTALSFVDADLVGFSLSFEIGVGYYVPVGHQVGENVLREEALEILFRMMYESKQVDFYNYRYDARILRKYGLDVFKVKHFDVMCLVWNADTNVKRPSLKRSSLSFLGIRQQTFENVIGAGKEDDMEEADQFVEYGDGVRKVEDGEFDGAEVIDTEFSVVEE